MRKRLAILLVATIALGSGCERTDERAAAPGDEFMSTSTIRDRAVVPEFAGAAHNAYLDLMYKHGPQTSKSSVLAASVASFEIILADYGVPASVIAEILEVSTARFDDLVDRGLMNFPSLTAYDPAGIAARLVETGAFPESDRADLTELITDVFSVPGSNKSGGYSSVVDKWREADCSQGIRIATEIAASSSNYWTQKHEQSPDEDTVAYDFIGGTIGFFFGGYGAIVGAGIASYMSAIYADDVGDH